MLEARRTVAGAAANEQSNWLGEEPRKGINSAAATAALMQAAY